MAVWDKIRRFFLPENTIRVLQMLFALILVSTSYGWSDKGVTYADLNKGDYDEKGMIIFFMNIGMFALIIPSFILIYSIRCSPRQFSPCLDIVICSILGALTFIASINLALVLEKLSRSQEVKEAGLNFHGLQVSLVFGMALSILFVMSTSFACCFCKQKKLEMNLGDSRNLADLPDDIPT